MTASTLPSRGAPLRHHIAIVVGDPLAVVVVGLVFDAIADRACQPVFGGLGQAAADVLDHHGRTLGRGLHQDEAAVERALEQRRQAFAIEFSARRAPRFQHVPQRRGLREAVERKVFLQEIAVARALAEVDAGHQLAHGFVARARHLVRGLAVAVGDQNAVGRAVVQPVHQRAESDGRDDRGPQRDAQRAVQVLGRHEAEIADGVVGELLAFDRGVEVMRELAGFCVPHLSLIIENYRAHIRRHPVRLVADVAHRSSLVSLADDTQLEERGPSQ